MYIMLSQTTSTTSTSRSIFCHRCDQTCNSIITISSCCHAIIITPLIIIKIIRDQRRKNLYILHLNTCTQVHNTCTPNTFWRLRVHWLATPNVNVSTSGGVNDYIFNFHGDELRVTFSSSSHLKLMNADSRDVDSVKTDAHNTCASSLSSTALK